MSKREKPWRNLVSDNARIAMTREKFTQFDKDVPVSVRITFLMPRPKTVKRHTPTVPPDIDKLCRAVLDALTDVGVWVDDSQVVDLGATKIYASGIHIGAHIIVEGLASEEA
jgi:Holliday junction resolvase RusA-like endonuclease